MYGKKESLNEKMREKEREEKREDEQRVRRNTIPSVKYERNLIIIFIVRP
jgi:hypothetical protein